MTTPGKEQMLSLSVTVSSGTGTGTISKTWDIARRIRCVPPNENVVYTFQVLDADGHIILSRESQTGTLSEVVDISLGIANSISITSADTDGTYTVKFDMH